MRAFIVALFLCMAVVTPARAQLGLSGQVDVTAREGDRHRDLNTGFRGDSPFNELRARIFARHWVSERVGVFAELLFDEESGARLNGAYVVVNELAGQSWLGTRIGLAPSLIGSFGLRSTYFGTNPLVGVPMVWQYRTTLDGSGLVTPADLIRRREEDRRALPILYDACWNVQWELLGNVGRFEYSLGAVPGAMSNPLGASDAEGVQVLARVGVEPVLGFRLGLSGGIGPYIGGQSRDPDVSATGYPGGPADYDQRLVGYDMELARGRFHLFSEGYVSTWEAPFVPEDLAAGGAYLEGRWDVRPRWSVAARTGILTFSEIRDPAAGGEATGWDDDVARLETALTYRWSREVHLRAAWQRHVFLTGDDPDAQLLVLQLRAVF